MPRKRKGADLGRITRNARNSRNIRSERTDEEIQQQKTIARLSTARQEEPEDKRAERNAVRRLQQRQSRRFRVNRQRTNDQQRQQKARLRRQQSMEKLRQNPELYQQYLIKKRDEKIRKRAGKTSTTRTTVKRQRKTIESSKETSPANQIKPTEPVKLQTLKQELIDIADVPSDPSRLDAVEHDIDAGVNKAVTNQFPYDINIKVEEELVIMDEL